MIKDKWGVHITHCCVLHGCKYGYADCPVYTKMVSQEYICESCEYNGITKLSQVFDVVNKAIKTCPHCNHIII